MKFPLYIARRYFFSRKSHNAINIITLISILGVTVCTAALVVILSVFNGFDHLIQTMFSAVDPELKIYPASGKVFDTNREDIQKVYDFDNIYEIAEVLEENVLLKFEDKQQPAIIKGVSDSYINVTGVDSMIHKGRFKLKDNERSYGILGQGLEYSLSYNMDFVNPIQIYVIKRQGKLGINPKSAIKDKHLYISGVFRIEQNYDSKYMFIPLEVARELLDYTSEVSALEIKTKAGEDINSLKLKLQNDLGPEFIVKNRYEQNEAFYKIMKTEKWAIFFILLFILIIASFNVIGSLSMLVLEKKNDISTLQSMGASPGLIKKIFLTEGWLITFFGSVTGFVLGIVICLIQIKFEVLTLNGSGAFIINAYPVKLQLKDLLLILLTVNSIGFVTALFPVHYMARKYKL